MSCWLVVPDRELRGWWVEKLDRDGDFVVSVGPMYRWAAQIVAWWLNYREDCER